MGLRTVLAVLVVSVAAIVVYLCPELHTDVEPPQLPEEYFGKGIVPSDPEKFPKDKTDIKKFEIKVDDVVLNDLKARLSNTRFAEPLDNVQFQYGFRSTYLKEVVDYWLNKFDWRKQEKELNKFSHFITQIEGINVHFIREKPSVKGTKVRVFPLLLLHGWPGSVAEFTKILPLLTTPRKDRNYVFEVICPSIPGYGFSEAPHQPGFSVSSASRVYVKLMDRLGYKQFFVQGGDWGAGIASAIAKVYPERVLGAHLNMVIVRLNIVDWAKYALGYFFPSFFASKEEYDDIYPLTKIVKFALEEGGYMHIQGTKPDTVGAALSDSPAGLAAYILEKFSTGTNRAYRDLSDGGLTKKFTLDELLTNIMVYWSTNTITSSVRFYKEFFSAKERNYQLEKIPIKVPVGVAVFPHEILTHPPCFLKRHFRKLVRYQRMPRGGHFAAMEEPQLLANEIWDFVIDVENNTKEEKAK